MRLMELAISPVHGAIEGVLLRWTRSGKYYKGRIDADLDLVGPWEEPQKPRD